ncbi:MAG: GtrA family protein [Lachnospiraceae bacterium]|nr:GtrA family protein [Lachnospiraceae bacterium]
MMMGQLWDHIRARLVNREIIFYFIFGVLTTLVDWISYRVMTRCYGTDYRIATTGAWTAAVLFAFATNKLFVFRSRSLNPRKVWREFVPFVACRIATGLFTLAAMIALVDGMGIRRDFICKIVVSGISLILNYVFSKWLVFRKVS